ncbi:MAG: hypothetical protein LBS85_03090 [Clostridiales Family XIII bacterium]|nr:hypothetical protein [Clostridiales Family XIII bacterium]
MGVKEYLETTSVFTIDEFRESFPTVTGYNLLSRAVHSGKVLHITRGLYASNTGRYTGVRQDRFRIASKMAPDVVFLYHSALELLGAAHSVSNLVQYCSAGKRKTSVFQGNTYKQYSIANNENIMVQTTRAPAFGEVSVTAKEQTLIDCLSYIGRGGGSEEVLRSLAGFPYIDVNAIKNRADTLNASAIARIGWLLEQKQQTWNVNAKDLDYLQDRLAGNAYRFVSRTNPDSGWSKRWKLILPASEYEMREWVE